MSQNSLLALFVSSLVLAGGCSETNPSSVVANQDLPPVVESVNASGQSSLKISVDPGTGQFVPGATVASVAIQAQEILPEYEYKDSPVSGGLFKSSTGFMTPLTASIGCDGNVVMGHGDLSLVAGAGCLKGKGE